MKYNKPEAVNMGLTSLIFRDTVKIRADYGEIVTLFKGRLNEKYFKGYIDKDETQLFYFFSVFHVYSDKIVAIPLSASILVLVFSYAFLLLFYRAALAGFKREIEGLTIRH